MTQKPTRTAHFVTQGKGGVGKSEAAKDLAQGIAALRGHVTVYDTDAVNRTISRTKALAAVGIELLDANMQINPRNFDTLMMQLINSETDAVIDVGSNGFLPLMHYLATSGAVEFLRQNGVDILLHIIIAGGKERADTANGFDQMLKRVPANAAAWLNHHFGEVKKDGRCFTEGQIFNDHRARIIGVVHMPRYDDTTTGGDIKEMTERGLTYAEAIADPQFAGMPAFRLRTAWQALLAQLQPVIDRAGGA